MIMTSKAGSLFISYSINKLKQITTQTLIMNFRKLILPLLIVGFGLASCGGNNSQTEGGDASNENSDAILGAGATFPYPFLFKSI